MARSSSVAMVTDRISGIEDEGEEVGVGEVEVVEVVELGVLTIMTIALGVVELGVVVDLEVPIVTGIGAGV